MKKLFTIVLLVSLVCGALFAQAIYENPEGMKKIIILNNAFEGLEETRQCYNAKEWHKSYSLGQIIDDNLDYGVNSSLSRTTFSSVTTLLAVIPLAILSSGDVRSFAICMIFGVVVGTYSSNFLATNVLYMLGKTHALDILKQEEEEDLSDAAVARRMLGEDEPKLKKADSKKPAMKKTDRNKGGNDPKILV